MEYKEFRSTVLKLAEKRTHKVTNSWGVYDAFKYYRKNKPQNNPKYILKESQFYAIIRRTHNLMVESLLENNDIVFPLRMGSLQLRKHEPTLKIVDDKLINNLPIDWNRTIQLWAEDEEAHRNKTLIRLEEKEVFKVIYNKTKCTFNNKSFYTFNTNRKLKQRLKKLIKENKIDAFNLWRNNNKVLK